MNSTVKEIFNETEIRKIPILRNLRHGYVYAFFMNGATKIGSTYQPQKRMKYLLRETGFCPAQIYISQDCRNYKRLEHLLHKEFKNKHRHIAGEWFQISLDEAMAAIKACDFEQYHFNKQ